MRNVLLIVVTGVVLSGIAYAQSGWTLQTNPLGIELLGKVQCLSPTEAWILTSSGKLLHTTNGGAVWNVVVAEPTDTIWTLSDPAMNMVFTSPTQGWFIATRGSALWQTNGAVIYRTTDGGATWSRRDVAGWNMGAALRFVDPNNGWAFVGNFNFGNLTESAILRTTNGGADWTTAVVIPGAVTKLPFFVSPTTGYAIAVSPSSATVPDSIWKTTDGGVTWQGVYGTGAPGRYNGLFFSDDNNGWVVGDRAKILHTTNGGTTWSVVTNLPIDTSYYSDAVFFLDAQRGWIGTKRNSPTNDVYVLHTTDAGVSWRLQPTPLSNQWGTNQIFSIHFIDALNGWLTADSGKICRTTTGGLVAVEEQNAVPSAFVLEQNYPNPFNPSTTIRFDIPAAGLVTLTVFDVLGRKVATLVNEELSAGTYSTTYSAQGLASGVYLYRLQAGPFVQMRKMTLMR